MSLINRTIPNDLVQAHGIVALCREFNWKSIAIVYINDAYGVYLSLGIQELVIEYGITAASMPITYEDDNSYTYAAEQIKELGIYIIVLVIHSTVTPFIEFEEAGILGYPYFYLGVDIDDHVGPKTIGK